MTRKRAGVHFPAAPRHNPRSDDLGFSRFRSNRSGLLRVRVGLVFENGWQPTWGRGEFDGGRSSVEPLLLRIGNGCNVQFVDTGGSTLFVRVLGAIDVSVGGRPVKLSERLSHLLCRLLVADGHEVSAWVLLDDVWAGRANVGVVKTGVSRLKDALGPAAASIHRGSRGYALRRDRIVVDADLFESAVDAAALADGQEGVLGRLDDAARLWRGEPFESLHAQPWLQMDRGRLCSIQDRAVDLRSIALSEGLPNERALQELRRLVLAYPHRESTMAAFATAMYRAGRQVEALRELTSFQQRLRDDIGVEPSPIIVQLERRMLLHDTALAPRTSGSTRPLDGEAPPAVSMSRAVVGFLSAGMVDEAVPVAMDAVERARADGNDRLLVEALCLLTRVASLAGQRDTADAVLREAQGLARRSNDAEALAHAALTRFALGIGHVGDGGLSLDLAEPLALMRRTSPIRIDLLVALAAHHAFGADSGSTDTALVEVEHQLRDLHVDQEPVRVRAIVGLIRGSRGGAAGVEEAAALVDVATATAHPSTETAARLALLRALMVAGEFGTALQSLALLERSARRSLEPAALVRSHIARAAILFAQGAIADAPDRIQSFVELGRNMAVPSAVGAGHLQTLAAELEGGHADRVLTFVEFARASDRRGLIWDAVEAHAAVAAGDGARADAALGRLMASDPWSRSVGLQALLTAALAVEASHRRDAADVAALAEPVLQRFAGEWMVAGYCAAIFGPVDRYRGLAAMCRGDRALGLACLREAVEQASSAGAELWFRWSQLDLSVALARGTEAERHTARSMHRVLVASDVVRSTARLNTSVTALGVELGPAESATCDQLIR